MKGVKRMQSLVVGSGSYRGKLESVKKHPAHFSQVLNKGIFKRETPYNRNSRKMQFWLACWTVMIKIKLFKGKHLVRKNE